MDERIYGLLGRKLGHSWSVPIHAALGNGAYRLLELEPDGLAPFLHRKDIGGLNVTIPYKRDVMPLCDEIDPAAEAIGSVNTIVRCADGKLVGYNTDIDGFLYMACRAGISLSGKKVVILGSGGASLTAQTAVRQGGAAEVVVVSRFGPDNYDNLSRHADAEILVNATPVGMYPGNGQSPVDLSVFPSVRGCWTSSTIPGARPCCCRRRRGASPALTDCPCWWPRRWRQRSGSSTGPFPPVRMSGFWFSSGGR